MMIKQDDDEFRVVRDGRAWRSLSDIEERLILPPLAFARGGLVAGAAGRLARRAGAQFSSGVNLVEVYAAVSIGTDNPSPG